MRVNIDAIAYALPATVLTNEQLRQEHPEWDFDRLEGRTGVLARHISEDGETALDLAARACESLVESGTLSLEAVDAVIFCTQTPDYIMPPNACVLHGRLGLRSDVLAFDINLACSGYIYGLQLAQSLIQTQAASTILLATSDTYSRLIHPGDRATRCLFGDGGAVSAIRACGDERGIIDIACGTAGTRYDRFIVRAGGARQQRSETTAAETIDASGNVRTAEHIWMDGLGVLSFFNSTIPGAVDDLLRRNGLTKDDIGLFVFHQASQIALESLCQQMALDTDKVMFAISRVGNLVSASIPVALKEAIDEGRAGPGDLVILCGFGVGLSWGTALLRL